MKLSIITICFNNKAGFEKTALSVIAQTYKDFEWIIIDGGSTDGTKELIEQKYASYASYWCSEPDGGIYNALNKGVTFAKGEYVNFMNAGDKFHDANVLKNVFDTNPTADILYGDTVFVYKEKKIFVRYPKSFTFSWLCQNALNHQSTFTKTKVFDSISFDTKYRVLADRKFWMICMLKGFKFEYVSCCIADYDTTGFSFQNKDKWKKGHETIFEEIVPDGLKQDFKNSLEFQRIIYLEPMSEVRIYGYGIVSLYIILNRLFFLFMKIRLINGSLNFIYKVFKKLKSLSLLRI